MQLFELTTEARAAERRFSRELDEADASTMRKARDAAINYVSRVYLAMQLEADRREKSRRNDEAHRAKLEADRIARVKAAYKAATVDGIDNQAHFFCAVLGAAITALDASGKPGTKEAHRQPKAATTEVKASRRTDYRVQLPAGVIAVKAADPAMWSKVQKSFGVAPTLAWTLNGDTYHLYRGDIARDIQMDGLAVLRAVNCGADAVWTVEPSKVKLSDDATLPALPEAVADAVADCPAGGERLLFAVLTK